MPRFFFVFIIVFIFNGFLPVLPPFPTGAQPPDYPAESLAVSPAGEVRCLILSSLRTVLASELAARISSITVDLGQEFKAGQPLVVFDAAMYQAQADRAAAEFDAAEKSLDIHRKLLELESVSELEMVAAESRLATARAELELRNIQTGLGTICAPFDGRVVKRIANPHEYVTPGQPLMEIIDQQLQVQLHVPSLWLRWLKPGIRFNIDVDETGQSYPARITRLGAQIDPVSQTIEVRAEIVGRFPELLAGMSGLCRFEKQEKSAP